MKTLITILFSLVAISSITLGQSSGNKTLSREYAEKVIKGKYELPEIQTREVQMRNDNEYLGGEAKQIINEMQARGLISVYYDKEYFPCFRRETNFINMTLTEEGMKYLISYNKDKNEYQFPCDVGLIKGVYNVNTCEIVFGTITGIQTFEQYNSAEVHYTVIRKNITPFGKAYKVYEETINRTEAFNKFDDGWRISGTSVNKQSEETKIKLATEAKIIAKQAIEIASKQKVENEAHIAKEDSVFSYAKQNLPSINQMKLDIIGKPLNNAPWSFDKIEEIKSFESNGGSFQKDTHSYNGNIEIELEGFQTKDRFHSTAIITYTWDIKSNTWNFKKIVSTEYHKISY